jgi:C4-type Zn-finger protein
MAMKEQVASQGTVFVDSADDEIKNRVSKFVAELDMVLEGNREITLVLDDPAGNSYVQVNILMKCLIWGSLQLQSDAKFTQFRQNYYFVNII